MTALGAPAKMKLADEAVAVLAEARKARSSLKKMHLEYLGFSVLANGREYSFRVAGEDSADRSFTVIVVNADFLPGKLKYQEGPDISYRKLLSTLAVEQGDPPMCLRQKVTEADVADYIALGSARTRKPTEEQRAAARERFRNRLLL